MVKPKKRSKKRRWRPAKQGAVPKLVEYIFTPLIKLRPDGMDIKTWLEYLFHIDERTIDKYISNEYFKMPGMCRLPGGSVVQGIGYRDIKPGDVMFVRIDTTMPDRIDIEAGLGPGRGTYNYQLDELEWLRISRFMKRLDDSNT